MNLPIEYSKVDEFVKEHNLFEYTRERLVTTLKAWYDEDAIAFEEYFYCGIDELLNDYEFDNYTVSFSTSYSCKPQLNYISMYIDIYDKDRSYVAYYQVMLNKKLEFIDDKLCK